jgi:hypothetical protein
MRVNENTSAWLLHNHFKTAAKRELPGTTPILTFTLVMQIGDLLDFDLSSEMVHGDTSQEFMI